MGKKNVYRLTMCALVAALLCIFGPMSVPIGPIPISLTNLVLYLAVYLIGGVNSAISFIVYIALGAVGLPVFSGFQGGLAKLVGPTGGYLVGFLPMVLIIGFIMKKSKANMYITALGMVIATVVVYALGTIWFVIQMDATFGYALSVCVVPFIPFDLGKIVIATILGKAVRAAMMKANLVTE